MYAKEDVNRDKMLAMDDKPTFPEWLEKQMEKEGLNQAELARRAGVTRGSINAVLRNSRGVGTDLLTAIAHGLRLPIETVYRAAGLLPPLNKESEDLYILNEIFSRLEEDDREEVFAIIKAKLDRLQKQKEAKTPRENSNHIHQS